MPQDAESGARANEYGHEVARKIAARIGAISVSETSNEFAHEGRLLTIRCAHEATTAVGVTYNMLGRVDAVVAAFEAADGGYVLYEMSPALYKLRMRDSKGEGKVGLVTKRDFRELGKPFRTIYLNSDRAEPAD